MVLNHGQPKITESVNFRLYVVYFCKYTLNNDVSGGFRISPTMGRQPEKRGRQPIIWPISPLNCMKMKKSGPRKGRSKIDYVDLDPPLIGVLDQILTRDNWINNLNDPAIFMKFNLALVQSFNWSFARKSSVKEDMAAGVGAR